MEQNLSRRDFLATAGTAAVAVTATTSLGGESTTGSNKLKILGIACSPRKGMTTAKAVQAALDAAKSVDARIEVELIDLGGLNIAGYSPKPQDDFTAILPKLRENPVNDHPRERTGFANKCAHHRFRDRAPNRLFGGA